jgi:hypothetical protein
MDNRDHIVAHILVLHLVNDRVHDEVISLDNRSVDDSASEITFIVIKLLDELFTISEFWKVLAY